MFHNICASLTRQTKDACAKYSQSVARLNSVFASKIVDFENANSNSTLYLWYASPEAKPETVQTLSSGACIRGVFLKARTSETSYFKPNFANLKKSNLSKSSQPHPFLPQLTPKSIKNQTFHTATQSSKNKPFQAPQCRIRPLISQPNSQLFVGHLIPYHPSKMQNYKTSLSNSKDFLCASVYSVLKKN